MTFKHYLRTLGYKPERYSGKLMYGDSCVSIIASLNTFQTAYDIGYAAGRDGFRSPLDIKIDRTGTDPDADWILYWPSEPWDEE